MATAPEGVPIRTTGPTDGLISIHSVALPGPADSEGVRDIGPVAAAGVRFQAPGVEQLDAHPVRDDLANLRASLPFLSITPFPKTSYSVAVGANVTGEIKIPAQAVLMKLSGLTPFFFTDKGNADGRSSAQQMTAGNPDMSADLICATQTDWIYCYGLTSVSVRSLAANNQIGAQFIMRDEI